MPILTLEFRRFATSNSRKWSRASIFNGASLSSIELICLQQSVFLTPPSWIKILAHSQLTQPRFSWHTGITQFLDAALNLKFTSFFYACYFAWDILKKWEISLIWTYADRNSHLCCMPWHTNKMPILYLITIVDHLYCMPWHSNKMSGLHLITCLLSKADLQTDKTTLPEKTNLK